MTDTERSELPPLLAFDEIDEPLTHLDDSMPEALIVDTKLRSAELKPDPNTATITAPVVGTLRRDVELSTGRSELSKHRLQGEVIWLETETVSAFESDPELETRPTTHVSDVHLT